MGPERRRVHYSGRVQGVGFRYTAHGLAQEYAVAGYVRNLSDGRVELVAEGPREDLDAFLAAVRDALGEKIRDVSVQHEAPEDPPPAGFEIRF